MGYNTKIALCYNFQERVVSKLPYVILWISSTFFAYLASQAKRRDVIIFFSAISILIPSLMGGLRDISVGNDVVIYALPQFNYANHVSSFADFIRSSHRLQLELGWSLLTYFSTKLFGSINWNFFFYQIIMVTCSYIAVYKHKKVIHMTLAWLMFLIIVYPITYSVMRNSIAASIIFLGFDDLENKHYGKFLIYVALGTMFHASSCIVVIYFVFFHAIISWKTPRKLLKDALLFGILASLILARPIMRIIISAIPALSMYRGYIDSQIDHVFAGFGVAGLLIGEIIICMLYPNGMRRVFGQDDMFQFHRYTILFNLIFRLFVRILATRMMYYFDFINVLVLASLPFSVREKNLRNLIAISVAFVALMYFGIVHIGRNISLLWPYKSIL